MNNVERAKQFLAFDALSGLQQALREREEKHSRIEKIELAEDDKIAISNTINKIVKGNLVRVTFYFNGHYFELEDNVTKILIPYGYMMVGNTKIYFEDIYNIELVNS